MSDEAFDKLCALLFIVGVTVAMCLSMWWLAGGAA